MKRLILNLLATLFALPACALDPANNVVAEEITGVVVDAETGKPIPGAVVAIRFERNNTGHAGPHCFRSMAVETDSEGRFRFAQWKQENTRANATFGQVTAYKTGYAVPRALVVKQANRDIFGIAFSDTIQIPSADLRVELSPFSGGADQRMEQLGPLLSEFTCRYQAEFDDSILAARVRHEIISTPAANVRMAGGRTAAQWIDAFIRTRDTGR